MQYNPNTILFFGVVAAYTTKYRVEINLPGILFYFLLTNVRRIIVRVLFLPEAKVQEEILRKRCGQFGFFSGGGVEPVKDEALVRPDFQCERAVADAGAKAAVFLAEKIHSGGGFSGHGRAVQRESTAGGAGDLIVFRFAFLIVNGEKTAEVFVVLRIGLPAEGVVFTGKTVNARDRGMIIAVGGLFRQDGVFREGEIAGVVCLCVIKKQ